MNNSNILYHSITMLFFTALLSSCLKETAVPIESAFAVEASEDKTAPITIQLKNESYGADEYEWTFVRWHSLQFQSEGFVVRRYSSWTRFQISLSIHFTWFYSGEKRKNWSA